jgi:hypothetical protein
MRYYYTLRAEFGTGSLARGAHRHFDRLARPPHTVNAVVITSGRGRPGSIIMLDPKEQKKGGFGAFAQRDRDRRDAEALKETTSTGDTAAKPASPSSSDATGSGTAAGTPEKP